MTRGTRNGPATLIAVLMLAVVACAGGADDSTPDRRSSFTATGSIDESGTTNRPTSTAAGEAAANPGAPPPPADPSRIGDDGRTDTRSRSVPVAPVERPTSIPTVGTTDVAPVELGSRPALLGDVEHPPRVMPTGVRVPSAGVAGEVVPVGVRRAEDELAVPPDGMVAAWYEFGPAPGETGSAVLAGHVDYDGEPGIFHRLADVSPGDELAVEYNEGPSRTFRVIEVVTYDKLDLPVADLFRRDGDPRLVLITCGGSFDAEERSYLSNVVVYAEPA